MEFTNLTRRLEIGANSYLLRVGGKNLILDSGLHPKVEGFAGVPDFSLVPEGSVDAIVVTHAHQDHIGSLPVLTRREQRARVIMTECTRRIGAIMLHNSVNVMMRQREDDNILEYPLFTHRGIDLSSAAWRTAPVNVPFSIEGERIGSCSPDGPAIEFFHAGHILGSAGVMIRHGGQSLFYTGDVSFDPQTLMLAAQFPRDNVDVLVMETTRGDSPLPEGFTRSAEEARFAQAIANAFDRGGSVTIPVFALGKTQEILAILWRLRREGSLPSVPIYIGGLSTKITTAYDAFAGNDDRTHGRLQLLHEMAPYVLSGASIEAAYPRKRCIYALSSGMMTEHTLSNQFARRVLPDPLQSLLFVGYSDPDSPAGKVRRANPGDFIILDPALPPVELRCHVEEFNFSAHASRERLLAFATALRPKKIVLVHGDAPAAAWFKSALAASLPASEVISPAPGTPIRL